MSTSSGKPFIKLHSVHVIANNEIAPAIWSLTFKRNFSFRTGQVVGLALAENDDARLYSIASGENDENIEIVYNIKPGGQLTPNLAALRSGDLLWVSPPFGSFDCPPGKACWIAAGTGIAPFLSMVRSGLNDQITLIHGSRKMDTFIYSGLLSQKLGSRYVRCCSQQEAEGVYSGRVTSYLQTVDDLPLDQKYYLCGSAEMVVECREILLSRGISFNDIVAEIYF